MERIRRIVVVRGIVQGVGFRPFVHRTALSCGVSGWVRNRSDGVEVAVEGESTAVSEFLRQMQDDPPPNATVLGVDVTHDTPTGEDGFTILASLSSSGTTFCPPDLATCDECVRELFDASDRRFLYPFINCTACGPRFTAVESLPYDRPSTSMACFAMCARCEAEYHDPSNRRYHAQPNACPVCGPRVWLVDRHGRVLPAEDPIAVLSARLRSGAVAAIKGIGGFHLAADATDQRAVERLRRLKARDAKPMAVMVANLAWARQCATIDEEDAALLQAPARPILVVEALPSSPLAPPIAPGIGTVGIMLPYSPIHHLLFRSGDRVLPPLIMTSGNLSDDPIATGNREALRRLSRCADLLLLHDRDIIAPADDSVIQRGERIAVFIRRSRGYVPTPIDLPEECGPAVGTGAFLKASPCVISGRQAFLAQHVGDLATIEAVEFHARAIAGLCRLTRVDPVVVGCDLNPDFPSSLWARGSGMRVECVQHHHAHVIAGALEHGLVPPVLGLVMDGTGFGVDGSIWGCELLLAERTGFTRLGHLMPLPLPGGDVAVHQPWRVAVGLLHVSLGRDAVELLPRLFPSVDDATRRAVLEATARGVHTAIHSSCGRLFDAVAALTGVCVSARFEAEAPMLLERAAGQGGEAPPYPLPLIEGETLVLDPRELVRCLVKDVLAGKLAIHCAGRFHEAMVQGLTALAVAGAGMTQSDTIVLTGGCMLNRRLARGLVGELTRAGLRVCVPRLLPVGDGAVSLGQAAVAAWRVGRVQQSVSLQEC